MSINKFVRGVCLSISAIGARKSLEELLGERRGGGGLNFEKIRALRSDLG